MNCERILVAIDLSDSSLSALGHARILARRTDASLILLWVEPEAAYAPSGAAVYGTALREVEALVRELRAETVSRLQDLLDEWRAQGGEGRVCVEHGDPAAAILQVAERENVGLIVTGTKGRTGFKRFFLGSVASKVARMSSVPVLVVRGESEDFERILVGTDFSPTSERALAMAVASAKPGAQVDVCHVWQYPSGLVGEDDATSKDTLFAQLRTDLVARANARGGALLHRHQVDDVTLNFVLEHGLPAGKLHEMMMAGSYDLVALGTHGYQGLQRFLLGSVAESIVRHAPCSVLVVRQTQDRD